jgi:hypothetical protein
MTDATLPDTAAAPPGRTDMLLDSIIGLGMIGLAFVGFVLTDAADRLGRDYWLICTAVYALASFWLFWRHRGPELRVWRLLGRLAIHWLGAAAALLVLFGLIDTGRIAETSAGLMGSVILALATYLAGVHGSWRLLAIGAAIGLGTVAVAFVEQYIWVLFGLALAALVVLVSGDRLLGRRRAD